MSNWINITEADEGTGELLLVGRFDYDRTERFEEDTDWDGSNHISVATRSQWDHEQLLRTAGGKWVINRWSQYEGRTETYRFVTDKRAREWLLINHRDEAAEKYFGEVEEEVGPGRPEIGPATNLRLGPDLTAKVDAAKRGGESRAAVIRRLLADALGEASDKTDVEYALCWESAADDSAWVIRSRSAAFPEWDRLLFHPTLGEEEEAAARGWATERLAETGHSVAEWTRDQDGDWIPEIAPRTA